LIEMLTNDNKEDEDIEDDDKEGDDKEDDDKDDKDVHQLHNKTKKKNVEVSTYSIAAVLGFQGSRNRFKPTCQNHTSGDITRFFIPFLVKFFMGLYFRNYH